MSKATQSGPPSRLRVPFPAIALLLMVIGACSSDSPTGADDPVQNPVPVLTSLDPDSIVAGSASEILTVHGTGFVATSVIRWNGTARTTEVESGTQMRTTLSTADLANPGTVQVSVATPGPGGGASASLPLTILPAPNPLPVLDSISPSQLFTGGGAATVTVHGSGFIAASVVVVEGVERSTTLLSENQLAVELPAAVTSVSGTLSVVVRTAAPGGGESATKTIEVVEPAPLEARSTVGTGGDFACALDAGGRALCWGQNDGGQLGDGTQSWRGSPAEVAGGHVFDVLAVGSSHACGLTGAGALHCWGWNSLGEVGNGTTLPALTPVPVGTDQTWAWVTAGRSRTCALTVDGDPFCWGSGGLGVGDILMRSQPTAVSGGHKFKHIEGGTHHICAIDLDGNAWCWGNQSSGRLGNGNTGFASVVAPVQVLGGHAFAVISAGESHTCALTPLGEAWCWGSGFSGRLGTGHTAFAPDEPEPVRVATDISFSSISAGSTATCATSRGGSAYCWGNGQYGVTAMGDERTTTAPAPAAAGLSLVEVTLGHNFTNMGCGRSESGGLWCWGEVGNGALGNGETVRNPTPIAVAEAESFVDLSVGRYGACALTGEGRAYCWGNYAPGFQDPASWSNPFALDPVEITGPPTLTAIAAGHDHSCGLDEVGRAWCWGRGSGGRLGDGTLPSYRAAADSVAGGHRFTQIAAGTSHTCALDIGGAAWCWGGGQAGQLGNGETGLSSIAGTPVQATTDLRFVRITAGQSHSCAIEASGDAWCWGANANGQLGNGSLSASPTPTALAGSRRYSSIEAGHTWTCAIESSDGSGPPPAGTDDGGDLYCWGENTNMRLGHPIGNPSHTQVPLRFPGSQRFVEVRPSAGAFACGRLDHGDVVCWGGNQHAQLGRSTLSPERDQVAQPIDAVGPFLRVGTGEQHACALTVSGSVLCWGTRFRGSLGDGQPSFHAVPVRVW